MNETISNYKAPEIRRGRVDSLEIYEVTAEELHTLERGSPRAEQINFCVGVLSAALTLLVSLLTAKYANDTTTAVAWAVFVALVVLGAYFFVVWARTKNEAKLVLDRIRARVQCAAPDSTALVASGRLPPGENDAEC